jgi:tRNA modification GTPase
MADAVAGAPGSRSLAVAPRPLTDSDQLPAAISGENSPIWIIQNKVDLYAPRSEDRITHDHGFISLSALTGRGIDVLLQRLAEYVQQFFGLESGLVTRERHRSHLAAAKAALARAFSEDSDREELIAEELRLAARALGRLTGKVDVEDVLDVIFRDFCIGK